MKTFTMPFFLVAFLPLPLNAHHKINYSVNHGTYSSHKGYAYEEKCFRYEYREDYIPGTSNSPGYVKSYKEKVSVSCKNKNRALNNYGNMENQNVKYANFEPIQKCTGNTTLGGLIGGGLAAALSRKDAYSWSIPLGAVLGAGIGNAGCK